MAETDNAGQVEVTFRQPKECTFVGDELLVGGFLCPQLGIKNGAMLLLNPADGTLSLVAECGCKVTASVAPMLQRLAAMLTSAHGGQSPGLH